MTPEEMQKKFWPVIVLAIIAIGVSLFFNKDNDKYEKSVEEAIKIKKEKALKEKE